MVRKKLKFEKRKSVKNYTNLNLKKSLYFKINPFRVKYQWKGYIEYFRKTVLKEYTN